MDVGTGTGAVLAAVARRQRQARLVGVDTSNTMLARARSELCQLDVQLFEMDAQRLDLPPTSFDVVFCSFALQSFDRPKDALLAIRRVLRTGGQVGLVYPRGWHFLCDERWRWHAGVFRRYGADIGMRATERAEIEGLLEQTGFESVEAKRVSYRLVFQDAAEWWAWSWSHGTRVLFEAVPAHRLPGIRRELEQGLHERCRDAHGSIEGSLEAFLVTASSPA